MRRLDQAVRSGLVTDPTRAVGQRQSRGTVPDPGRCLPDVLRSGRARKQEVSRMARSVRLPAFTLAALLLALTPLTASAQAHKKSVVGPGDSIQAAVDAAKPGAKILVSGLHRENVAITKDGIELRGLDAVLEPPTTPTQNACFDPSNPTDLNGICVLGDVNFDTGEVNRPVDGVTVRASQSAVSATQESSPSG